MKTIVQIEVTHSRSLPNLADLAAQRIYTIQGVDNAEVVSQPGALYLPLREMAVTAGDPPAPPPKMGWLDRVFGNLGKRA